MSVGIEVHFGVAKIGKYATRESGDTLEMIERPHGGLSIVLADGQRSGKSAKRISNVVVRKAVQLLAEGVRDGAVARAAHDYLYAYRGGKVSSTLNILSVDTRTRTIVVSRNNPAPVIVRTAVDGIYLLDEPSKGMGTNVNVKPVIQELPLQAGTTVVAFTDGLTHAGTIGGDGPLDPLDITRQLLDSGQSDPQHIADTLVMQAIELDKGRPRDDISVVVITVWPLFGDEVRRLSGRLPL
ncbi:MAG TPA: PP2C family protein-serine/threonine phosphatase [Anaerolineae bacterium]|nr:PP2C family protein-serine/threonine phosphatase [Anaerolineae bacterium]